MLVHNQRSDPNMYVELLITLLLLIGTNWQWLKFSSIRKFFFFKLLFSYSCPHFSSITLFCPTHPHFPHSVLPTLLSLSMGPLYMFPDNPFPSLPRYPPSLSPLVTVILFFISMSQVTLCLLICFVDWFSL